MLLFHACMVLACNGQCGVPETSGVNTSAGSL